MPINIRQQVFSAIRTQLETILTDNGYNSDAGENVFEWRDVENNPLQVSELPGLVIRDTLGDVVQVTVGQDEHIISFEVDAYHHGSSSPTLIREVIADVVTAMAADKTFVGLVEDTVHSIEGMSFEHGERRNVKAEIVFVVTFRTDHMDPYNQ